MTLFAQLLFPRQANGSLVSVNGKVVGSAIIGQLWTKPQYFHGRPSAAGKGYDPTSTGGTNLGPTSKKLIDATKATIGALEKENPDASGALPIDLVTSSGSGIDPDISPEAAYWEAPRVAKARNLRLRPSTRSSPNMFEGERSAFSASLASTCSNSISRSTAQSQTSAFPVSS